MSAEAFVRLNKILPRVVLIGCAIFSLGIGAVAATTGWNNNLLEDQPMRQMNTALTIDYLLKGGPWLAYETPECGPPWSIPYEFPLYQLLAAGVKSSLKLPLVEAARFTSLFFFYVSFIPGALILRQFGVSREHSLLFAIIALSSPLYLFWSRTCMMESLALCLCLWYLYSGIQYNRQAKLRHLCVAGVAGVLASLVKMPTLLGFALLSGALLCAPVVRPFPQGWRDLQLRIRRTHVLSGLVLFALPAVVFVIWLNFSDVQKRKNPISASIASDSPAMYPGRTGTLQERFSRRMFNTVVRTLTDTTGNVGTPFFFAAILPFVKRRWLSIGACTAVFVAVPFILTGSYTTHNYYPYACGLFLLGAQGFIIEELFQQGGLQMYTGVMLVIALMITGVLGYHEGLYQLQAKEQVPTMLTTAEFIRHGTSDDQVVVFRGLDWDPVLIYYSGRRGILLGPSMEFQADERLVEDVLGRVPPGKLGMLALCSDSQGNKDEVAKYAAPFGFETTPWYSDQNCSLYRYTGYHHDGKPIPPRVRSGP
jgi:hypothetical protein